MINIIQFSYETENIQFKLCDGSEHDKNRTSKNYWN